MEQGASRLGVRVLLQAVEVDLATEGVRVVSEAHYWPLMDADFLAGELLTIEQLKDLVRRMEYQHRDQHVVALAACFEALTYEQPRFPFPI